MQGSYTFASLNSRLESNKEEKKQAQPEAQLPFSGSVPVNIHRPVTCAQVFKALCTDPETGLPVDPKDVFRKLDAGGTRNPQPPSSSSL
jgi:hypothetical protein